MTDARSTLLLGDDATSILDVLYRQGRMGHTARVDRGATMRDEAELLADLLDGRLAADEVPTHLAELAELAEQVRTHVPLPLPTPEFREALQDQVVEAAVGQTAAGTTAGATAAGGGTVGGANAVAAGTTGWVGSLVAGVAATAVLAGGGLVVAAGGAVPGDATYGVKQQIEELRLAVADGDREARLLVEQATERVREAVALVDTEQVDDLLDRSGELVDRAVALAGPDQLAGPLATYADTLRVLASRTEDAAVAEEIAVLLEAVGGSGLIGGPGSEAPGSPQVPSGDGTSGTGGSTDDPAATPGADRTPLPEGPRSDPPAVPTEPPTLPTDPPALPTDPPGLPTDPPDLPTEVPTGLPTDVDTPAVDDLQDIGGDLQENADDLLP